jgi:hypothetical protein
LLCCSESPFLMVLTTASKRIDLTRPPVSTLRRPDLKEERNWLVSTRNDPDFEERVCHQDFNRLESLVVYCGK